MGKQFLQRNLRGQRPWARSHGGADRDGRHQPGHLGIRSSESGLVCDRQPRRGGNGAHIAGALAGGDEHALPERKGSQEACLCEGPVLSGAQRFLYECARQSGTSFPDVRSSCCPLRRQQQQPLSRDVALGTDQEECAGERPRDAHTQSVHRMLGEGASPYKDFGSL